MNWRSGLAALLMALASPAAAQSSFAEQRALWNQPVAPFRIIGNVHYVGTAHIAAYLITDTAGHVLIDGGMEESAPQIAANIAQLGFRIGDVRHLLINHAHWDHAGGLAELKRLSGASLVAGAADAADLALGFNSDRDDVARFAPVVVDRHVGEGDQLRIGADELVAHLTPGHTRGCTSWTFRAREGDRVFNILFACSLTVAGRRLVGADRYPEAATDFATTFARLRALEADVFLGFHTGQFGFDEKRRRRLAGDDLAFVDPGETRRRVEEAEAAFRRELAAQHAAFTAERGGGSP
jgi:metallo-beta-lactamase class B